MSKWNKPRRGSLAFSPRKRASSQVARIRTWTKSKDGLLGFAGYKVGMTHLIYVDDWEGSYDYGKEIFSPVTIIETPPIVMFGLRLYEKTKYGLRCVTETWAEELHRDLKRKIKTLPKTRARNKDIDEIKEMVSDDGKSFELRALVHTQPRLTTLPKKRPEVMEIGIGDLRKGMEIAEERLGKEIRVNDVFSNGEFVDVLAVTKGKGFQGPVKRWGIKIQPRKAGDKRRHVGNLGPWHPARTMWTVPQAGQMGYHQRTEYNKRIMGMFYKSEDEEKWIDINPKGGFPHYGVVRNDFLLIEGSVPGPIKRLIRMRPAIRPPKGAPVGSPEIKYIHGVGAK